MNILTFPSINLLAGSPGQGKTYLTRYLTSEGLKKKFTHRDGGKAGPFNHVYVFCKTKYDREYNFLPDKYIFSSYNPERLKAIIDTQEELVEEMGKDKAPHCLVILDDIIGMVNFASKLWQQIFSNYRHANMSFILSTQYLLALKSPVLYNNTSYVILFKQTLKKSIKALYESFSSSDFENEKEFGKFLTEQCVDKAVVICDVLKPEKEKKYHKFKAPANYKVPKIVDESDEDDESE